MAELLKGAPVASAITERVAARARQLAAEGTVPTLAIIRVGERQDDLAYERGALKRCAMAGVEVRRFILSADCTQGELFATIGEVNADRSIHGCLMFRPLPEGLDEASACAALDPAKDVDGVTPASMYGVYSGDRVGYSPCTAEAVVELLDHYGIELRGARVTVVGRSLVIGKPVSLLLQARDATVTMCHTKTRELPSCCRASDVLVVAAGHAGTVGADAVSERQVVVDVGINWDAQEGRLVGDVVADEVAPVVGALTPVPGGVGSITTAVLVKHVVDAAGRLGAHHG